LEKTNTVKMTVNAGLHRCIEATIYGEL